MENFTIDVGASSNLTEQNEKVATVSHPCYILLKVENGDILYEMNCEDGHESEFSILLASLKLEESFDNILATTFQMVGGELILSNLSIVLDTLMKGDKEYSPIIHPVSVYNNAMDGEFGEQFEEEEDD